jgi:hypothetical protein
MSGGTFDYKQYEINTLAEELEAYIADEELMAELPSEAIIEMRTGLGVIRKAAVYAHRIDWLLAGDDGPESFLSRLDKDLEALRVAK